MAQQKNIASSVEAVIRKPLEDAGYSIWDVEYLKEGSEWWLRITIDAEQGIDIDDCEKAYRIVDPIIDELDPIENYYHLEVTSPGVERELRTLAHYKACIGQAVVLKLFTAANGQKELVGILVEVNEDGNVCLTIGEDTLSIEKAKISKAHIYFDYDSVTEEE